MDETDAGGQRMDEADVGIVGAGPFGLMLAVELGRRGVRCALLERAADVARAPQANATQARTMEHYRRIGIAQDIRLAGLPLDHPTDVAYFTTLAGRELARHPMPASRDAARAVRAREAVWNGPELPHRVPQSLVERRLLEEMRALPSVEARFGAAVVGFEEDAGGVHIALANGGAVSARYLVGADGGASTVRKALGIRLAGADPAARDFMGGRMLSIYLDAPAFYDLGIAPAWMYWTVGAARRALLASVDGRGAFVLQTQLREGETADTCDPRALFLEAVGREIPCEVTGTATWQAGRALVAERFGAGRVLIGGDAAHLFTPTGGMGYNTAVDDAVNLGWKLASVVRGAAAPALLESYEAERRPVAIRNTAYAIAFADSIGLYRTSPAIDEAGPAGAAARARAGAYLAAHAAREFEIPGFTLGARYEGSPIVAAEDGPPPPDHPNAYVPTGRPGGRAPHLWLEDGRSLFDAFGPNWTLLLLGADTATGDWIEAAALLSLDLAVLNLSGERMARDLYEAPLALIRPDQIVAWRGPPLGGAGVQGVLRMASGAP